MHHQPQGAAFDVVLLLHVACVVVGLATTVTAAATATRLRRLLRSGVPLPEPVRRYFRPGVNWAGRAVYGIPVFGFALVALSQGAYSLAQGWVLAGVGLFVLMALLAEGGMWPAERRVQAALAAAGPAAAAGVPLPDPAPVLDEARVMARSAVVALALLLAGVVVMIAQP